MYIFACIETQLDTYIYIFSHRYVCTARCAHAVEFHMEQHEKFCLYYVHLSPVKNAHLFHSEGKLCEENHKNLSTHLHSPC